MASDDTIATELPGKDALGSKLDAFRDAPQNGRLYRELRDELRERELNETLAELSELRAPHEKDPRRIAEVWAEAGKAWLAGNQTGRGQRALEEALKVDPANEQAATALGDLYLEAKRYAETAQLIERELEALAASDGASGKSPNQRSPNGKRRAERHRLLAKLWDEHLGRVDRALSHWQQAWQLEQDRTEALEAARSIYASLGDDKMVTRLYRAENELLGPNGPSRRRSEIEIELGRLATRAGEPMTAANHFEVALQLDATSMPAREALVGIYTSASFADKSDRRQRASQLLVELGEHRLAEHEEHAGLEYLERALSVDPHSSAAADALERAQNSTERWEELDKLLRHRQSLAQTPPEREEILRRRLHLYDTHLENRDAQREVLIELAAQSPLHGEISQRLRDLYRDQEDWAVLASHIEAELPALQGDREKTNAEMLELATIVKEHLGDRARAAAILHRILQNDPRHAEALARYGEHFRERRDWRGLADLLDFAVDTAREAGAEVGELVRQLEEIAQLAEMRLGDIDRAINTWHRIRELEPDSPKPDQAVRRLMSRAKMWESLVGVLEQEAQAAQTAEQRAEALRRIAQVYRERQVNPHRAIGLYEEVVSLFPDDRGALKALRELYERESDKEGLARTMRRELDLEARAMGASDVQRPGAHDWPAAKRSARLTALRRLVPMYETLEDTEGVVFSCTGILEILPGDRAALDRMEHVLEKAGDIPRLEQTLEYHASSASGPAERAKVLRRLARLALLQDDEMRAMQRWENMLQAAPNDREALENLADLYERHNRFTDLATVLERMLMPHRRAGRSVGRAVTNPGGRGRRQNTLTGLHRLRTRARGYTSSTVDVNAIPDRATRIKQLKRYAHVVDDKLGDAARSIMAWEQVVDMEPKDRGGLEALGRLYEAHESWQELADALGMQAALYRELLPPEGPAKTAEVVLRRAQLLDERLGAPADAITALEGLLDGVAPSHLDAHALLRQLYESQGDFEAAVRIAERELYLSSETADKIARGLEIGRLSAEQLGDPYRALQAYERVLGLDPEHREALAKAAELYASVENWTRHAETLAEQVSLCDDGHERRSLMSRIAQVTAERLEDHKEAFSWYRKAYREAPDESSMAELRRAADAYGLWKELAEVFDEERDLLDHGGKPKNPQAYIAACRELAAIAEHKLDDKKRAMNVLYDAISVQPRDARLLAEVERIAREADDRQMWQLLLECMDAAVEGADRNGRVVLHGRRARILEEHLERKDQAAEELLKAFAWAPEREATRRALYELAERMNEWGDVVAAESALLERAGPRGRLVILRRKAAVIEERLEDPVRAFRCHLVAFLLSPDNRDTIAHLWRLAKEIGTEYDAADKTPKPEPPSAFVHPSESGRITSRRPPSGGRPTPPRPRPATKMPVEIRATKAMREDSTMDLSLSDLQTLHIAPKQEFRDDATMDLSPADLLSVRVPAAKGAATPVEHIRDSTEQIDISEVELDEDSIDSIAAARERSDSPDPTIELRVDDLMQSMSGATKSPLATKSPGGSGSSAPPPFLPGVSSPRRGRAPSPPPPPRRAAPPPPPVPKRPPLPHMPVRAYQSPWEEFATAYEMLPLPDPQSRQRCLFRIAEIWENGAGEINRAFNTLARALDLGIDDSEARARLHRLATEHEGWDQLAELYETAAEEAKTQDRAIGLFMEAADIRVHQRRANETETLLRRVLGMRPNDHVARHKLEALYRDEERWGALAACLEERTDPRLGTAAPESERPALLRELAEIYHGKLNRPHDAIDALQRLRALLPEDVGILRELGELYGKIGRWSKVIEMLNRVGEIAEGTPDARDALRRIAQIYETELELPDRAIVAYSQVVASWPDDSEAHAALDTLYEAHSRWQELADILRRRAALTRDSEERSKLLRRRAKLLLDTLDAPEDAAAALRHARTLTPDAPGLADELVRALIAAKREREAAAVLSARIDAFLADGDISAADESIGNIAALMIRLAVLRAEHLDDPTAAKALLGRALELVPDHPTALAALAKIIESEEDPRTYAEARLREAEALDDVDAKVEALMKAGYALRDRCQDIEAARVAFEEVLAVRPYHPDATWALAGLVEQGGDLGQASQVLQTRLEDASLEAPEKARIMTQLAALARQAGIEAAAESHLIDALEAEPTHLPAIIARADLLGEAERFEDLEQFLNSVLPNLEQVPSVTLAELHRRLAIAQEQLGRDDDAYQTLRNADRLHRGHLLVKLALGENRYRARRWNEAARYLGSLAMHVDATDHPAEVAEGLYHAAMAEIRSLRPEKAKGLYERALDLKPNYTPALHAMAELAMEAGDHAKAADLLTRQATATEDPVERMRLFEALGDMAVKTLADEARARTFYEAAVNAASPLESRHMPLLDKLIALQRSAGDQRGVALTSELMASFDKDAGSRAAHYIEAAENYLAIDDGERALAAARRAVEAQPYDLAAVNILTMQLMSRDEFEEVSSVLGRALSGKGEDENEFIAARKAPLWNRLGRARKARGDLKGAASAWEKAVEIASNSDGAMASRRELLEAWKNEPSRQSQLLEFRRVLAADSKGLEDVVNYARALCGGKHDDGGRAMLELAEVMGHRLGKLDRAFLDRRPVYQMAADEAYRGSLDPELRAELVLGHTPDHDEEDDLFANLLLALWEASSLLWPESGEALAKSGITGAERVPAISDLVAAAMFPCITSALDVPATVLYASSADDAPDVQLVCVSAPIVVLGPRLQVRTGASDRGKDGPTDSELRFLLGRAAEMARPENIVAAGLPYEDFVNFLSSVLRCFAPDSLHGAIRGLITDEDVQRVHDEELRTTLPVKLRTQLEELLADASSRQLDPDRYVDALTRSADRAGLLVCGDIATACAHAGDISAGGRRMTRHLIDTVLRPSYLAARATLGVGVR